MSRGYRRLAWIAPMLTRPYRSPGKFYPTELFAEFIYSLVTPRKLAVEASAEPSRKREEEIGNRSDVSTLFEIDTPIAMQVGMNICSAHASCIYLI